MRMEACGQTMAHLPQSMQMAWLPDGDVLRDAALLPPRGRRREGAVHGHGADRQEVALAGHDAGRDVLDEVGRVVGHERPACSMTAGAGPLGTLWSRSSERSMAA